eukprot:3480610-Rhodomonas_salina.4
MLGTSSALSGTEGAYLLRFVQYRRAVSATRRSTTPSSNLLWRTRASPRYCAPKSSTNDHAPSTNSTRCNFPSHASTRQQRPIANHNRPESR